MGLDADKLDLKGASFHGLQKFVEANGEPKFRASQILGWLYNKRISNRVDKLNEMSNLSKNCIDKLLPLVYSTELAASDSDDSKLVFTAQDGKCLHSIVKNGKLFLASQIGCSYSCEFCVYGKAKLTRDLTTGEIIDQVLKAQKIKKDVEKIVFGGMGEPLANYDSFLDAIKIIQSRWGFEFPVGDISVYTCGVVPEIKKLADNEFPIQLVVGLHSVNDEVRSSLMDVNKKYPVDELLGAVKYYSRTTGVDAELEYMLLSGVNDSYTDAKLLIKKLLGLPVKLYLTTYEHVSRKKFVPLDFDRQEQFLNILIAGNIKAEIR